MLQSGVNMPTGVSEGTSSQAIDNARKISRDGWNQHGNKTAEAALANDAATVRKNIDPKSLGPTTQK